MQNDPLVEQMKKDLASQGYQAPVVSSGADWHSQIKSKFADAPQAEPSLMDTIKSRTNAVIDNPGEALRGAVKGGIKTTVDVTKGLESAGKEMMGAVGMRQLGPGLDYAPVDEMTQYSNEAQKGGANLETAAELYYGGGKELFNGSAKILTGKGAPLMRGVLQGVKDFAETAKNKLMNTGLSKTPEEILATPESLVHKLSQVEREYYKVAQKEKLANDFEQQGTMTDKEFVARRAQLDAEHNAITARTNAELASKTAQSEKEIADFSKEVEQTAYNKTLELKPKAREVFTNQSKTYQRIIEEDLAPHKDLPITSQEISDVVKNALPDDPAMADKLLGQLGKSKTVGELYESIKGVKAGISKGGKSGRTVMTREDMQRDDVAAGLSDLLKEKGVDLIRANDFWKQWKPVQKKINLLLKPYDSANLETKTFSEILKSSGDDIHNQNFIKEFENVLGEPITGETQAVMSRLSAAQKAKVAAEVDAKMAIEDARLAKKHGMEISSGEKTATVDALKSAKQTAEEALKLKQFQIDRLAARRQAIKTGIKTVLGAVGLYEGNKILKDTTGFGF